MELNINKTDDGKGKFQSFEIYVDGHNFSSDSHSVINITAYGKDESEATRNLLEEISAIIQKLDSEIIDKVKEK